MTISNQYYAAITRWMIEYSLYNKISLPLPPGIEISHTLGISKPMTHVAITTFDQFHKIASAEGLATLEKILTKIGDLAIAHKKRENALKASDLTMLASKKRISSTFGINESCITTYWENISSLCLATLHDSVTKAWQADLIGIVNRVTAETPLSDFLAEISEYFLSDLTLIGLECSKSISYYCLLQMQLTGETLYKARVRGLVSDKLKPPLTDYDLAVYNLLRVARARDCTIHIGPPTIDSANTAAALFNKSRIETL